MTAVWRERRHPPVGWRFAIMLLAQCSFSGPAFSQDVGTSGADVAVPAALVAPGITADELAYRLIPLNESELVPMAKAWLVIVRDKTADYWTVYCDLTHRMKETFRDAKFSIPYPQKDIHIRTKET